MPLDILSDPVERGKVLALAFVDGPDTFLYVGGSFAEVPWLTISHSKLCFCSLFCSFSVKCLRICMSSMPCDGSSRMTQTACGTGSIKASCRMRWALSELCCLFQIDRTTMCSTLYEIDEQEAEHALSL